MAYDAATGNIVLFGGESNQAISSDTWTWDGSTWTKQAPATSPPARELLRRWATTRPPATSSCSAATSSEQLGDTWTWDGLTWTKQAPRQPGGRPAASMAYDKTTRNIVLFGGLGLFGGCQCEPGYLSGTWTWGGSGLTNVPEMCPVRVAPVHQCRSVMGGGRVGL